LQRAVKAMSCSVGSQEARRVEQRDEHPGADDTASNEARRNPKEDEPSTRWLRLRRLQVLLLELERRARAARTLPRATQGC
ncbi:hypothetical protein BOX15_Mlig031696g2, partial [Macrostomum lignano]